jgi:carbonic anhydrase/acetyltransferase-like protein (isoleucine patch superfamily)
MIYSFKGFIPVVHPSSFVHPLAAVTGNVIVGRDVYIGPGAAIRGDWGGIIIEDGCNVQENCTIHAFPGLSLTLEEGAHLGHGAIVHGAHIGQNVMVGMNAVVMDEAIVGAHSIIGALSFVKAKMVIPERSLVVGNPARVVRELSDDMIAWKTKGTRLYQKLPGEMQAEWEECEPLREVPRDRPSQERLFDTWESIKGGA